MDNCRPTSTLIQDSDTSIMQCYENAYDPDLANESLAGSEPKAGCVRGHCELLHPSELFSRDQFNDLVKNTENRRIQDILRAFELKRPWPICISHMIDFPLEL